MKRLGLECEKGGPSAFQNAILMGLTEKDIQGLVKI
jgi:hypothetical protein